jgi:folate-binding Fe-S cluster repair protein YgfZ
VSVDFDKGCFLGQELVARIDSRGGNTPRHLRLLEADGDIGSGDPVRAEGVEVGRVTSAQAGAALAMLKRSVGVGDTVRVGEHEARVRELPVKTAR